MSPVKEKLFLYWLLTRMFNFFFFWGGGFFFGVFFLVFFSGFLFFFSFFFLQPFIKILINCPLHNSFLFSYSFFPPIL